MKHCDWTEVSSSGSEITAPAGSEATIITGMPGPGWCGAVRSAFGLLGFVKGRFL
jgi:hypothetical protein